MAYALILIHKKQTDDFFHVEDYLKNIPGLPSSIRGDFAKMRLWNLIEKNEELREDGSNRNGLYKITQRGRNFVQGKTTVKSHVLIYDNRFLGFDGDQISIADALGEKFSYAELMGLEH